MNTRIFWLLFIPILFIITDIYAFQAVKTAIQHLSTGARRFWTILYWCLSSIVYIGVVLFIFIGFDSVSSMVRNLSVTGTFGLFITKVLISIFLIVDDLIRLGKWIAFKFFHSEVSTKVVDTNIDRSEFLAKAGLIVATIPLVTMTHGIVSGAYDYRVRRQRIALKNLPYSFHGMTIAQISDIHSGSFFNKKAVTRGIEMILAEKPDMIFFTGDLVNNEASEMRDYQDIFSKLKAPMGVYSILGNHDYGDYKPWGSREAKNKNMQDLIATHKNMGWDLLINDNRIIKKGSDKIAILGIEHWGAKGNFPKYGKMKEAYKGTEDASVKLLLSHDPSHWKAQVIPQYQDIDITFSGHTHGFQFGIDTEHFKWSPVQYFYDEWAGLYKDNNQLLYVNRGFGFLGFPGRIGILPEITLFELVKA